MKVKDLMTKEVITVRPNTSIVDVAKVMKEKNIGSVPVCEGNSIVGIITDRDIVLRNIAMENEHKTAKDIMTKSPTSISPNDDIHSAAHIMAEKQIRRLPVVDSNNLVGIVALGDIAVNNELEDNAGVALNDISKPSGTM